MQVLFFPAMKPEEQEKPKPQATAHPVAPEVATTVGSSLRSPRNAMCAGSTARIPDHLLDTVCKRLPSASPRAGIKEDCQ